MLLGSAFTSNPQTLYLLLQITIGTQYLVTRWIIVFDEPFIIRRPSSLLTLTHMNTIIINMVNTQNINIALATPTAGAFTVGINIYDSKLSQFFLFK